MDRIFKYALIFSLIFHATLIIEWPFLGRLFPRQDKYKSIEITYLKIREPQPQPPKSESFPKTYEALPKLQQPTKMVSSEKPKGAQSAAPSQEKSKISSETKKSEVSQPLIQREEGLTSIDLKGQQTVPPSYAQAVRNKIKERLNSAKPDLEGNVFVRFVIASDGELRELNIIDEKSTRNGLLRELVFESIKDAAPFPGFPREFASPEVTFTCQILFQVK